MPKITSIKDGRNGKKYIYVDNEFFVSCDSRIVAGLNLDVGMVIEDLSNLERKIKNFWKDRYRNYWDKQEKNRIEKVINLIKNQVEDIQIEVFGFGTSNKEYIDNHPIEKGIPDLAICYNKKGSNYILAFIEVTGTRKLGEKDELWIRPDKIKFAENHPCLDIYIAHFVDDLELLRFIDTKSLENLRIKEVTINSVKEIYAAIPYDHNSILNLEKFISLIRKKIFNLMSL